jgi:predicted SnoaL-like aldol condensation-catalyzing enzyme
VVPEPPQGCSSTPATLTANKQLVTRFFDGFPTAQNVRAKAALLAPDYIQHNPRFAALNQKNGVSGREGFVKAIESGVLNPPPGPAVPPRAVAETIAQCTNVAVVWKHVLPDPDEAGRTWEAFTFDTFRVENALLAEHWDGATR